MVNNNLAIVNNSSIDRFNSRQVKNLNTIFQPSFMANETGLGLVDQLTQDTLTKTQNIDGDKPGNVNTFSAIIKRLPDDVIKQVNETGHLPENMMITELQGKYYLGWKEPIFNGQITGGTNKMPEHLELRKDILGFTRVVPKGYEHWMLKKAS